ncbi:hypothetical protein WJ91_06185 [Burkholderia ubonensis]|nr:hypothetical protein WJ91_06185 [Burkholderia ubonensis]
MSRAFLRERGMEFTSGEDELGRFDEGVVSVDGVPFIFQQYVQPKRGGFAIEAPRKSVVDSADVSRRLSALLEHFGIEFGEVLWRHSDIDIHLRVPELASGVDMVMEAPVNPLRAAAAQAAARLGIHEGALPSLSMLDIEDQFERLYGKHYLLKPSEKLAELYGETGRFKDCLFLTVKSDDPSDLLNRTASVRSAYYSSFPLLYPIELDTVKIKASAVADALHHPVKAATGKVGAPRGGRKPSAKTAKAVK